MILHNFSQILQYQFGAVFLLARVVSREGLSLLTLSLLLVHLQIMLVTSFSVAVWS